jgi:prepilin-type N-terminal cleavage/methylation domain-containing protein
MLFRPPSTHKNNLAGSRRAFTLVEMMVALTIFGLVMAAVTRQLIKGVELSLKTATMLEFAKNGRALIDRLNNDVANAQAMIIYSEFADSTSALNDGYGNYVVMHQINTSGTITRTVGYYLKANATGGTYSLYRHDSQDGAIAAGTLPDASTSGTHRVVVRTVRVPSGTNVKLFRDWEGKGFTLRGQFGTPDGRGTGRLENVQCTLTSRS